MLVLCIGIQNKRKKILVCFSLTTKKKHVRPATKLFYKQESIMYIFSELFGEENMIDTKPDK